MDGLFMLLLFLDLTPYKTPILTKTPIVSKFRRNFGKTVSMNSDFGLRCLCCLETKGATNKKYKFISQTLIFFCNQSTFVFFLFV